MDKEKPSVEWASHAGKILYAFEIKELNLQKTS